MIISEISVRRPVLAAVISLVLFILGLLALSTLSVREYPDVQPPVVSINTFYTGASGDIVERRITQVIEDQVAGLPGVVEMTSRSQEERSTITMEFALDRDIDGAANDIRERVARVLRVLPEEADPPQITKQDSMMEATMYVDVSSDLRSVMDITDYAERGLVDRLGAVDGVASIRLSGGRRPAMRVWLDREALAARGLTVQDVERTLRSENVELPAGRIESVDREFTLRAVTALDTPEEFGALVIGRGASGRFVRLAEVADIRLEPEDMRSIARSNRQAGVSLGIVPQAQANIVAVNQAVKEEVKLLQSSLPDDISVDVNVDFSEFVGESMREVFKALTIALGVVLVVMLLFLSSWRATLIPGLTIPVSVIAAAMVLALLGYTINTLTLLAAVLAIGLVVDDAIVVLENIVRHREQGSPPLLAAIDGSRQIGFAVIATTVVLVSVFLPVALAPGRIGVIFGEFGITLAAAVAFSSVVALTLVPMLCSRMMRTQEKVTASTRGRKRGAVFRALAGGYRKGMTKALAAPWLAVVLVVAVSGVGWYLFDRLDQEYTPTEDRGMIIMMVRGPEGSSLEYMDGQLGQIEDIMMPWVDRGEVRRIILRTGSWGAGGDVNSAFIYSPLEPRSDREFSSPEIAGMLRGPLAALPGVQAFVFLPPSLNMGGGQPLQVVLRGNEYDQISEWRDRIMARVRENPGIANMNSDYYETKPEIKVTVDRARATDLGVSLRDVGETLQTMLGSRRVTTFIDRGEEYNVVLQATEEDRVTPQDLNNIYVRSVSSGLVPLASLVRLEESSGPRQLSRFNRRRAIKLSANVMPGYSLGEAIEYIETVIEEEVDDESLSVQYDGESREYKESGGQIYFSFLLALLICFLVLAAQFESFIHPFIILLTVPLALTGGMLGLNVSGGTLNVFSLTGCIMLIGLAAKNGILIVEFSNQLRDRGLSVMQAVLEGATTRLRPVLMTSLCTIGGSIPLIVGTGAGTEARRSIGVVVLFGVLISVVLTLYVVPCFYAMLAGRTRPINAVTRAVQALRKRHPATTAASTP